MHGFMPFEQNYESGSKILDTFCQHFMLNSQNEKAKDVKPVVVYCIGQLRPGGTVVEGTAGNTGIGLAHMCLALGYKCVIFMPDNQSQVHVNNISSV